MYETNIGKRLKIYRVIAELSGGAAAKKLEITRNYLSLLENNHADPSLGFLRRASVLYGVPISFILGEAGVTCMVDTKPALP